MAIWQMLKGGKPTLDALFDDGQAVPPSDPEFSLALVAAHEVTLAGEADGYNYVGESPQSAQ